MQYLELPQPPSLNEMIRINRTNKYQAAASKSKWTNVICRATKKAKLTPYKGRVWVAVALTYPHKGCDPDNLFSCLKYVFDGIVKAGLLPNDNAKTIQSPIFYEATKEPNRVVRLWFFDNYPDYRAYLLDKLN